LVSFPIRGRGRGRGRGRRRRGRGGGEWEACKRKSDGLYVFLAMSQSRAEVMNAVHDVFSASELSVDCMCERKRVLRGASKL